MTVKMPSSVVAVIPSRWATAISFFIASVTVGENVEGPVVVLDQNLPLEICGEPAV